MINALTVKETSYIVNKLGGYGQYGIEMSVDRNWVGYTISIYERIFRVVK